MNLSAFQSPFQRSPQIDAPPKSLELRSLSSSSRREQETDVLILGAGLSGTSLAHHLIELGYEGRITLLDKRTNFDREQRWCTWSDAPPSLSHLVSHRWNAWRVNGTVRGQEREARCTSQQHTYSEIYAPHFFRSLHDEWRANGSASGNTNGRIELVLGEEIGALKPRHDGVVVDASNAPWRAQVVFDTRFHSELDASLDVSTSTARTPFFAQTFVGRVVEFERDVFTANEITLMDFRLPQPASAFGAGVHFGYVLPYSSRRALVETTAFTPDMAHRETHNRLLDHYLRAHYGSDYRMISEEAGFVPMTSARPATRTAHERVWRLGVAGGMARPSSGYAFANIQRVTQSLAQHIVAAPGHRLQAAVPPALALNQIAAPQYRVLDEVFLEALRTSPEFAGECFVSLFSDVPTDCLVRFLTETSSPLDACRIIAALPKTPFITAAMRRVVAHCAK